MSVNYYIPNAYSSLLVVFNWKRKGEKKECGPGGSSQAHPTTPQQAQGKANSQQDVIKGTPSGARGQGSERACNGMLELAAFPFNKSLLPRILN